MRIAVCPRCHEPEMLDDSGLCLKCSCELNPELARKLKEYQENLKKQEEKRQIRFDNSPILVIKYTLWR